MGLLIIAMHTEVKCFLWQDSSVESAVWETGSNAQRPPFIAVLSQETTFPACQDEGCAPMGCIVPRVRSETIHSHRHKNAILFCFSNCLLQRNLIEPEAAFLSFHKHEGGVLLDQLLRTSLS